MLTERPGVERIKRKNIIDLALGLTAMTRIFSVRSKARDWPKIYPRHHPLLAFRRQLKACPLLPDAYDTGSTRFDTV